MLELYFTRRILGPGASLKLARREVIQTLRSVNNEVVQAIFNGELKKGDRINITLDGKYVGGAKLISCFEANTKNLTEEDAEKGGFGSLQELHEALKRAGFRFKSEYRPYRVLFEWVE